MRAAPEPEPASRQIPTCMKRIRAFSFIIIIIRKSIKLCIAFGLNDLNQIVVLFMISRCHNNNNGNNIWHSDRASHHHMLHTDPNKCCNMYEMAGTIESKQNVFLSPKQLYS